MIDVADLEQRPPAPPATGPEAAPDAAGPSGPQQVLRRGRAALDWLRFVLATGPAGPAALQAEPVAHGDWLHEVLAPLRPAYLQVVGLAFSVSLLGLLASLFSLQVYDRVIAKGGYTTLAALLAGMVLALVLDHLLRQARALLMQRIGARIEVAVARAVYERVVRLPALALEQRPPAYWQATFRDIELVRSTTAGATALLLIDLPFVLVTLVVVGLVAWPLLPVTLLTMIAFAVLAWRSERVVRRGADADQQRLLSRDTLLADLAASRLQLKSGAPSTLMRERFEAGYARWLEDALQRSHEMDHYRDAAQGMSVAATVISTSVGAVAILNQLMSMGALTAANILTGKLISPMVQLVTQWRSFGQFEAARRRLGELFALPLEAEASAVALPRPAGALRMETLGFRYPGSPVDQVSGLSGQLGPAGLHAIVGTNGSGKSTLLRLLRGLYPAAEGRVLLDGADLGQFGQADRGRWIGLLNQQPRLVAGSIRDNIALGAAVPDDERIVRAARMAGAYDFIVDLPDGFDTDVGEGGARFSGGQRKRIAIAQVLYNDPPVLLLDEPTSDLDSAAEAALIEQLRLLAADHTVVAVTHSPALLRHCNGLMVMDRGRLAAAGPARELLPRMGLQPAPSAAPQPTPAPLPKALTVEESPA